VSQILLSPDATAFELASYGCETCGWSPVPCHLPGVEDNSGVRTTFSGKRPLVLYKQYRAHAPSLSLVRRWHETFTTDAGEPNWTFITGHSTSGMALYVVDTDAPQLSPWLQLCNTTTVRTGRPGGGWHTWFTGPTGLYRTKPALELPDGSTVRFQGVEGIIVLPGSLHASGTRYTFVDGLGLDALQPLPPWLVLDLQPKTEEGQHKTASEGKFPGSTGGRDCINQIWESKHGKGWRHTQLYVLSQELWNARNKDSFVEWALRQVNERFDEPLDEGAIKDCMKRGWEKTRPDNKYGPLGCVTVLRDYLPWLDCSACPHRRDMLKSGFDTARAHGLGPNEQSVLMLVTTHGYKSDNATAEECHMDRATVKKSRELLQALGLWPLPLPLTLKLL